MTSFSLPPQGWSEVRLKFLKRSPFEYGANEAAEFDDPTLPRFVRITDVKQDGTLRDDTFKSLPEDVAAPYLLAEGDILFARSGATVGKAFMYRREWGIACFAGYLIRLRPDLDKVSPDFIKYYTQSAEYQQEVASVTIQATIQNVSAEKYGEFVVPLPPLPEQHFIAAFLDLKTAEIDAVIAKKERLIGLLQEERQALISRAVTRGPDAGVAMKDSGIPWLGQVPKHWAYCRVKNLITFITSGSRGWAEFYSDTGDLFIQSGNLNRKLGLDLSEVQRVQTPLGAEAERTQIRKDDVLVCVTGAYTGNVGIVESELPPAYINQHIALLRANTLVVKPKFLALLLASQVGQCHFVNSQYGGTKQGLGLDDVRDVVLFLPPLPEQQAICEYIDASTNRLDRLTTLNREQIAKLREYRQSLISAAVTGKLAVPQELPVAAPVEPVKKPNPYFRRSVFAAEIINQLCDEPTFGHVKFQKCLYVAQYHLGVEDFEENYHRMAAGPYDNQLIHSVDSQLARQKWFEAKKTGDRYSYLRMEKAGQHRKYFDGYFADRAERLTALLDLFRKMDTEQAEIVATIYAVWNDFLILNEPFDEDRIIADVLTNWHEAKQRIPEDRWRKALLWMRQKNLVPHGFGKPTRSGVKQGGGT